MTRATKKEYGDQGFLRRLTLATAWGEGLDGFDLGVLSVALPLLAPELGIQSGTPSGSLWQGLLLASSLVGIFFGSPIGGFLADRLGRKRLFLIDICLFVVLGVLQAFVVEAWQLFVVRLLLGIAIGAEYSIGSSMLSEFIPANGRGRRVSYMLVFWYGGYLLAVVAAYVMHGAGGVGWRWILAMSAVPALVVLGLRIGLPESPRWLMMRNRIPEARAIIDRYLGGEEHMREADYDNDKGTGATWRDLFAPAMRSRMVFVTVFYICVVTPYFAIFNYAPAVFSALGIPEEASTIASNVVAFVGALVGMLSIEHLGRRKQLIGPFWISAVVLAIVGVVSIVVGHEVTGTAAILIITCIALFAFFNALMGNLTAVYPTEVFPTDVRATGVGVVNAFSRVGAAAGTFLFPIGIDSIGVGWCMAIGAVMCVVGAVVSQALAPETTGQSLTRTGVAAPLRPGIAPA